MPTADGQPVVVAAVPEGRRAPAGADAPQGEHPNRLAAALDAIERLPALAGPRDGLLRFLRQPNPVQNDVVAAIESDPALTIAVLAKANRSRGAREPANDVREAVAVLPAEGIEFLAKRLSVLDFFEPPGTWLGAVQRFRIHAIATQAVADNLAVKVGFRSRGRLRVSSLLHDLGKLVLAHAYAGYTDAPARRAATPEAGLALERRRLGIDHAAMGGVAARRLGLPAGVITAIQEHHGLSANREARIIRLADAIAHFWSGDPVDPAQLTHLARSLELSPELFGSLVSDLPYACSPGRAGFAEPSPLSPREREVLGLLSEGKPYNEIATQLGLSSSTVRTHLHKIYRKMGVADRAQAVLSAAKRGWI